MKYLLLDVFYFSGPKSSASVVQQDQRQQEEEEQQQQQRTEMSTTLPIISHEHVMNHPPSSKSTIPKRVRPPTHVNMSRWNTSTHVRPNAYVPDLADTYPRDPFTKMPPKRDAIEVYRLLQSNSFFKTKVLPQLII
jgi:hypothetical protein